MDISQQAISLARRFLPNADLICAPLEKAELVPCTFDVIALWDVIEHVDDPEALLLHVRTLLRTGGIVIMETPDESCFTRCLARFMHRISLGKLSLLPMFYYSAHKWYFSRRAMSIVLQRLQFDHIAFYCKPTIKELLISSLNSA